MKYIGILQLVVVIVLSIALFFNDTRADLSGLKDSNKGQSKALINIEYSLKTTNADHERFSDIAKDSTEAIRELRRSTDMLNSTMLAVKEELKRK